MMVSFMAVELPDLDYLGKLQPTSHPPLSIVGFVPHRSSIWPDSEKRSSKNTPSSVKPMF
ncbi:hypothetical protein BJX76DRAFT_334800 [Aspergillus varians]